MKKKFDYQFIIWLFIIGLAVLASSCESHQAKVQKIGGTTVSVIDIDEHITPGDTILSNRCHCLVVVKETYHEK